MENKSPETEQELLPKPLTDLPLPEKQIPAHLASQGDALQGKKRFSLPIIITLIILVFVLIFVGIAGAHYFIKNSNNSSSPIPSPAPVTNESTSDSTADWQTYTNTKRGYSFKYPTGYTVEETSNTANTSESVLLEKDAEYIKGGGMGGSDALSKGASIVFVIWPKKDLSEAALKDQFGTNAPISKVDLGGKTFTKVTLESPSATYFYDYSPEVLEISSSIGGSVTEENKNIYINEYGQILTTFKFTDLTSTDTSSWKTYISPIGAYEIKYPVNLKTNENPTGDTAFTIYASNNIEYFNISTYSSVAPFNKESMPNGAKYLQSSKIAGKTALEFYTNESTFDSQIPNDPRKGLPYRHFSIINNNLESNVKAIEIGYFETPESEVLFKNLLNTLKIN